LKADLNWIESGLQSLGLVPPVRVREMVTTGFKLDLNWIESGLQSLCLVYPVRVKGEGNNWISTGFQLDFNWITTGLQHGTVQRKCGVHVGCKKELLVVM
jgi:hypothetical protein